MLLLGACCATPARAQFAIDWFSLDGGGGTSSGGAYVLSGTIGQADVGRMTGGAYSLEGGFWAIGSASEAPVRPMLSIRLSASNSVVVTWPSPSTGWVLQQRSDDLASSGWSDVLTGIVDDGTAKSVETIPLAAARFYRLKYSP
jgi:hypothetical protein